MARSKPTGVTGRFSPFSRYLADRDLRALIEHMMGKENINSIEEEVKKMIFVLNPQDEAKETEWGKELDNKMRRGINEMNKMDNLMRGEEPEEEE